MFPLQPLRGADDTAPETNQNFCSMRHYNSIINKCLQATGICLLVTLAACSDDEFDSIGSNQNITFAISENDTWSRSGNGLMAQSEGSLSTLTLNNDSQKLYLIPEVSKTASATSVHAATSRANTVDKSTITSFGVYAAIADAQADAYYMENVEVTKTNSWAPIKEYQWPGSGSLHINALSPYCPEAASATDGGITTLPSANPAESPSISFIVPQDVTKQFDLMWATPQNASTSPCLLTFNHALAGIRFVAGADLAACTIKSITISNVAGSGTLNIETGEWADIDGTSDYTATLDVELAAAEGSNTVAEGTAITDDDHTFMLMPQTLGEEASVTLTIESNGAESVFTASLAGQTWAAGNTYTYRLSANPELDRFVLTATSPLSFNYTGGTKSFNVTSLHEKLVNGVLTTEEVPWIAEFVDNDGNVIETPAWITSFAKSGNGTADYEAATQMVEPEFVRMSEQTRKLRSMSEVGSAESPYNLSNSTGAATVENTANCYIINAPGTYSLPLVYGNAIKNGAENSAAYGGTRSSSPFVNHLGNRIQHPYIYDNAGCSDLKDAVLVWEGRLNMVRDVRLSADRKSIVFDIPAASIRQGNAVVGLRDKSGNIMWSWQLWVTDYVPGTDMHTMTYSGKQFHIMPVNLGNLVGGDETDFASSEALVRFTQKPADGSAGKSVTIKVQQTGKHVITPDCHSFYQWGRKDPMISGIKEWYYADHTEIEAIETRQITATGNLGNEFEAELIKTPQTLWIWSVGNSPRYSYTNQWNVGTTAKPVKTVYDPCPVGFRVPGNEFLAFRDVATSAFSFTPYSDYANPAMFHFANTDDGTTIQFPALGYRSGKTGSETVSSNGASMTELWTSHANNTEAIALILVNDSPITHKTPDDARVEAFGIRPIAE